MSQHFLGLYQEALAGLKTGGMTLEASLQEIEEGKQQAIAGGQQALVSGGLAGTTMAAGVPLQAEKIAARQRLGARGRAEQTYLTTLASFAAFAQRGIEAQREREAAMERTQAGITGQIEAATIGAQPGMLEAEQRRRAAALGRDRDFGPVSRVGGPGWSPSATPTITGGAGAGAGGYAQQFPSIYDQGGGIGTAPSLTGDGGGAWEVFGDQYQLTYGGGRKETISQEQYGAMEQAGQLPGGDGGAVGGGGAHPSLPAGPGFTYTWIGGPSGHYTISSTPGSTGEDVGMENLATFAGSWLGQGPTPGGGL